MKKRLPYIITASILIIGVILGSFFDLQINAALFSNRNPFGIVMSAFGLIPGYAFIAFLGGVLFRVTLKGKQPKWLKVILYILSFVALVAAAYFSGKEFFSVNGFDIEGTGMLLLGIGISLVIDAGVFYLGFRLSKDNTNDKMWIIVLILTLAITIALVAGVTAIKSIMHRPRYRTIQLGIAGLEFHQWWEPFKEYKSFIVGDITKEEFKSFPSGHSGAAMLVPFFLMFLPLVCPKLKKHETVLFIIGCVYCGIVMFSRMLVGAHFLTDVCFGALLTLICFFIANEVIQQTKLL